MMQRPSKSWQFKYSGRRNGMSMTAAMFDALHQLRAAKDSGFPFIDLPDVSPPTIRALSKKDWLFISPGLDGVRYTITGRGHQALRIFEMPVESRRRLNRDLCQNCQSRPRKVAATGYVYRKCDLCEREHTRRRYHLKRYRMNPEALCPDCNLRPRHKRSSGHTDTYCLGCKNARNRLEKRQRRESLLKRIQDGEVLMCPCGKAPRHHTENSVYDWCWECWSAYMTSYNDKRRPKSKPALERSRKAGVR